MPGYKMHLVGGTVAFWLLLYATKAADASVLTYAEWYCWALFGSLFPDIDTKSKGQKLFYSALVVVLVYLLIKRAMLLFPFLSLMGLLPLLTNHRGLFHRVWFVVLCPLMLIWYAKMYAATYVLSTTWAMLFFGVGALSHLLLDFGPVRMWRRW